MIIIIIIIIIIIVIVNHNKIIVIIMIIIIVIVKIIIVIIIIISFEPCKPASPQALSRQGSACGGTHAAPHPRGLDPEAGLDCYRYYRVLKNYQYYCVCVFFFFWGGGVGSLL